MPAYTAPMLRTEDDYECEILRMEKALRAALHRFAPHPADLEDLLQETYSHLFRLPAEQRRAIRNLQAFALTSARNVAMDWLRRKRVVPIDSVEDVASLSLIDEAADLEAIVHGHQQLLRLAHSVSQLSERSRAAFTLRHVYGLSQKEIAQRLKISEGAVEQLLVRGLRRCSELMDAHPDAAATAPRAPRGGLMARWRGLMRQGE